METNKIVVVEDEELLGLSIQRYLQKSRYDCQLFIDVESAIKWLKENPVDLVLSDIRLPVKSGLELLQWIRSNRELQNVPAILMTAFGTIQNAVKAMKDGATDYIRKPLDLKELEALVQQTLNSNREVLPNLNGKNGKNGTLLTHFCEGSSAEAKRVETTLYRLIKIEKTTGEVPSLLITGATGTGKSLLARRLQQKSLRKNNPFVELNCTTIPESLFESELFGHIKGSFTGATEDRIGLFRQANGGTIFLDEIGELPLSIQSKLLKVIEDKVIRPVGSNRSIGIDVRIILATNQNLEQAVVRGDFRQDLFHRINLIQVNLVELSKTPDDIIPLVNCFFQEMADKYQCKPNQLSKTNRSDLLDYSWPGNIRELKNEIERVIILFSGDEYDFSHLRRGSTPDPKQIINLDDASNQEQSFPSLQEATLDLNSLKKELIEQALIQSQQIPEDAALLLNISEKELEYRINKYQIKFEHLKGFKENIPAAGIQFSSIEKEIITGLLKITGGNVSKTSRSLNISRDMLRYRLDKYNIPH